MKSKILQVISHPVTHFNVVLIGTLGLIQIVHTHAHYTMEMDADSYVTQFIKKNPDFIRGKCYDLED